MVIKIIIFIKFFFFNKAALRYGGIIKTLMSTSFYAAILPSGIIFALLSLIL